ncbi:hypothetical protein Desru_3191 [Desulforamulus ruminis DSM 2154]|uniref:Uncharacterized protein n=1 Tax=Desulforamulus ruminis (strain ATCC 23193 / DSM 2154 / NCIMB 8452 / DL) TaxID=696281 RepID=F6DV05_DESRL|nr:hypothetical protein Desru_3191 [Desulforamulus ruminis DSM 2154]
MNNLIKNIHKIAPGEKSVQELIDFLKYRIDIVQIATYKKLLFFISK